MVPDSPMPLALFYRGLLYALAERRRTFVADGDAFHAAFKRMLETASAKRLPIPADDLLEQFDPVFGLSPHAAEMLFEGERDFILSLMNPRLVTASFKITAADAQEALGRLNAAEVFRALATDLDSQLPSPV